MDVIYFPKEFLDALIKTNPDAFKKCDCGKPDCDIVVFDNGFAPATEPLPENVVQVDFVNRKRML